VDKAPGEVYASLLDEGTYLCSVRTMYRVLSQGREVRERRNQLRHPTYKKPELLATGPNQVWSWDITKLPGPVKWTYYYLFVILDIFSRYVVGWMLAARESSQLAQRLIRESIEKQGVSPGQLVIHSDRGPSMKSHGLAQLLATLGVTKSHSRPHVSNDNPFSESHFKTVKYRPSFPDRFGSQEHALSFCREFFPWYNYEHYHSGIGMLTPAMVHYGYADLILAQRQLILDVAYLAHPERFVKGPPAPGHSPHQVWINPPIGSDPPKPLLTQPQTCFSAPLPETDLLGSRITSAKGLGRLLIPTQKTPRRTCRPAQPTSTKTTQCTNRPWKPLAYTANATLNFVRSCLKVVDTFRAGYFQGGMTMKCAQPRADPLPSAGPTCRWWNVVI
jgi:putative transposase